MSEQYPWMSEFLRSFDWCHWRVENGMKVSYEGSFEEILTKSENPETFEREEKERVLAYITAGLQLIFGKYWNHGCMERLKTVRRKADENDIRTPFKATDARERYLYLMEQLNFVGLYTKYRIVRDDLTQENEPVKNVQNLLHDIRTANPKDDPLSDEIVDCIRTYFRRFAVEFSPYLKDSTDSDAFVFALYNMLAEAYTELTQKKQEACEVKGTEYKPGEAFTAFSKEADEAGEVLQKWYNRLEKRAQQSLPLDIHVYDRAIRDAIKAAEEDRPKGRGRKKRTDPVLDEEILKETSKNSALNLMSDAEFEFLQQVALMKVSVLLRQAEKMKISQNTSNKLSWENAPGKLREDAANALVKFSHDDAILAYLNVDRSRADEVVGELLNTIRYPLYPMQRKLGDALLAFLDMTQDTAQFNKRCDDRVQFSLKKQLEKIAETLSVDITCHPIPCALPEREIGGEKLWLDVLLEKQAEECGITQERRKQILTNTAQILQLMFGRYLRPECKLRLAESVRRKEDAEAYRKSDEYELYHVYCCLVRECRGVFEVFLDECWRQNYVNKKKAKQIESFNKEMLDFIAAPEFPGAESLNRIRQFSEKAADFCTEQQRMQFHENAANETLFDVSWSQAVLERYDVFKYHPVYSFQEQRHILRKFCAYIGSVDEGMRGGYDLLWARIFRLDDAAEMNREHIKYEAEKKKYDEKLRKYEEAINKAGQQKQDKPEEPIIKYSPGYCYCISDAESGFLAVVCTVACGIKNEVTRITPKMISEKNRNDLLAAVEALAQSESLYYYIDISQSERKHVRQIAENHLLYPRACRINCIIHRFCKRAQEIGLFDDDADKAVLHKWAYFVSGAADATKKKYYRQKANNGNPLLEMLEKFAEKSRINGFRTARKSSVKPREK